MLEYLLLPLKRMIQADGLAERLYVRTALERSAAITLVFSLLFITISIYNALVRSPLSRIPGPKLYALTNWRLALDDYCGTRTRTIHRLHKSYGPALRVRPKEVSFSSLTALRTIYGAGSGFHRSSFYSIFDVYGEPNLFTFPDPKRHGERKKLLIHAYSKSSMMKPEITKGVQAKVVEFMQMLEREPEIAAEIFSSLHYYSLDQITHFLYGNKYGGTTCMQGDKQSRRLLDDVLDPARRKLAWYAVHLPSYTKWLMTRAGLSGKTVEMLGLLPQKKPTVYTGIRTHALQSWLHFKDAPESVKHDLASATVMGKLWPHHDSQKNQNGLEDMEVASEVADHLLAGVDTTSDTLMFLIWALSRPQNRQYQEQLAGEVASLSGSDLDEKGVPTVEATDKLTYLHAVIKETLRLYAPLPASEPRYLPIDTTIDGYVIPAYTTVSIDPYTLHRNPDVFPEPLKFNPERWLGSTDDVKEMRKWWWAFSSGARMCIGMHLAMAEMTTLTAAIYRKHITSVQKGMENVSPGITSRFEVFYDESCESMEEHICHIIFTPR